MYTFRMILCTLSGAEIEVAAKNARNTLEESIECVGNKTRIEKKFVKVVSSVSEVEVHGSTTCERTSLFCFVFHMSQMSPKLAYKPDVPVSASGITD